METNRLRQFCVLTETKHLREAAKICGISHSGLAKSMRVLQDELGVKLYQQEGRHIVITDAGIRVSAEARRVLTSVEQFQAAISKAIKIETIKIGTFEVFSTYFMSKMIATLFPDQSFLVRELLPGQIEDGILANDIDFGITYIPIPKSGLSFLKITALDMGIYAANKAFRKINLDELPFAAPAIPVVGSPNAMKGLDGWPDDIHPRKIKYSVDMLETALDLTRRGLAVVYIPKFIAKLFNEKVRSDIALFELDLLPKKAGMPKPVYLVKRKGSEESAIAKKIARAIREFCK